MKKFLKILAMTMISAPISLSVIACSGQPDWNGIPIPPPKVPIDVTGFNGVDFQAMNINDYDTVAKLFTAIENKLATSPWKDETATTWTGNKDGQTITDPKTAQNLGRNGTYTFEIKSNISFPGDAKFIITITNSRDISDNMLVTNLGLIDDIEQKTILIKCVFNNMNLVNQINEIADEYLDNGHMSVITKGQPSDDKIVTGTATLTSPDKNKDGSTPYFTGTVTVNFSVKLKKPPSSPVDIKSVIKKPNLGPIPDNRYYTIMMFIIIKNFVDKLDSLAEIINNLNITNIEASSAKLSNTPNSKYYIGSIDIAFTVQK